MGLIIRVLLILAVAIISISFDDFERINRNDKIKLELYGIEDNSYPIYPRNYSHIVIKDNFIFSSTNILLIEEINHILTMLKPLEHENCFFSCKSCIVIKLKKGETKFISIGNNCTIRMGKSSYYYNNKIDSLLYMYSNAKKHNAIKKVLPTKGYCD